MSSTNGESEDGDVRRVVDGGRSMRAMETTPATSLDTGKAQGNHSFDACSWGPSRRGGESEKKIARYQAR